MENKYYVSYEAARLLKEKGYNEVTNAVWNGFSGEMRISPQNGGYRNLAYPDDMKLYSAPTKSEAIDWLESKGIVISVEYINGLWDCNIYSFVDATILHGKALPMVYDVVNFPTRLEAEDAAIIRALKEITKL